MQVYESLGIPVDRQVVEQYLQLPQVASDFANYLQLYNKYKQVYRVDELLSGTWEPVRASELRDAPFDEKLGVLGLLLSRLADGARDAYRLDALTDALHADLLAIREGEKAIASLPDEKRAALADKRNGRLVPTRTRSMSPPARWSVWMPTGRRSCLKKYPRISSLTA